MDSNTPTDMDMDKEMELKYFFYYQYGTIVAIASYTLNPSPHSPVYLLHLTAKPPELLLGITSLATVYTTIQNFQTYGLRFKVICDLRQ
jgi:hypothetical protein